MSSFKKGEAVILLGLVARRELNGERGTLARFLEEKERWSVRLASGEVVNVKPGNLKRVSEIVAGASRNAVGREFERMQAAGASTADCAICMEPLNAPGVRLESLGCGHRLHRKCWTQHCKAHAATLLASHGDRGQSGARCPLCNAWHGFGAVLETDEVDPLPSSALPSRAWFMQPARALIHQMLGYVYQARWQAVGQDRSVQQECAFIDERFRLVAASRQAGGFEILDAALARFREAYSASQRSGRAEPLRSEMDGMRKALMVIAIPHLMPERAGGRSDADDQAYIPFLTRFLMTCGLAG